MTPGYIPIFLVHGDVEGLTDTLFENNQNGTFTNLNATCRATNPFDSEGVANGDINNDGKLAIVLANRGINYQLFKNEAINSNN
ncbi:MAG: VCBS repeat-containing protein [Alcanivoracaceae bacterium]|nr:VCBS repeat-containing protein [Alcanivoracaceae bacterium]